MTRLEIAALILSQTTASWNLFDESWQEHAVIKALDLADELINQDYLRESPLAMRADIQRVMKEITP